MRVITLPSALLLALGACLYLLPPQVFDQWRLSLYGYTLMAQDAVVGESPASVPDQPTEQEVQVLRNEVQTKTAVIASLRRELARVAEARSLFPTVRFRTARLLALHGEQTPYGAVLDVGAQDDLRQYSGVLQGRALVGCVSLVGTRTSLVTFVTAPESLIAARDAQTGELCSVRGGADGVAVAVFYGARLKAAVGDKVSTSGLLESLPAGLEIGVLAEAPHEGREPGAHEARIKLYADVHALDTVLLVHQDDISSLPPHERDK